MRRQAARVLKAVRQKVKSSPQRLLAGVRGTAYARRSLVAR